MSIFSEKIAELRKSKCMTQEELASTIGVSAQSISKWENNATMPDIMLLPVIADIFDVSIDTIFGREKEKTRTFPFDDIVDESFDAVLHCMNQTWQHGQQTSDIYISNDEYIESTKKYLAEYPDSQTAIYSDRNGAVYANSDIALIFKLPKEGCLGLLEDESAVGFVEALSNNVFRTLMIYQLENHNVSYTVSSIAKKCSLNLDETENALKLLEHYTLIEPRDVDLEGEIVKIYSFHGGHKMLLIYSIMTLAKRLANYKDHYRGFRGTSVNWVK